MEPFSRLARQLTDLGLLVAGVGIATVVIGSWVIFLTVPGLTYADAWASREPWTSIGTWLTLIGATTTILTGAAAVVVQGGLWRRVALILLLVSPALWWATAVRLIPGPGVVGGPGRPPFPGWEPAPLAYQFPLDTALFVLLPALAITALVFVPRHGIPTARMAPVHEEE